VTIMVDKSVSSQDRTIPKAKKAAVHHSPASEHFRGSFPLFVNRYQEGFELRQHDHDYLEIVYVVSGGGYHYIGDSMERIMKGHLYILPVGTSHILRPSDASSKNKLIVINLCIRPEFIDVLERLVSEFNSCEQLWSLFRGEPGSHIAVKDSSMQFGKAFEQLLIEFEKMKPGYETSMIANLMQLTVQISRQISEASDIDNNVRFNRSRRKDMSMILAYVHEHLTEPLTLDDLADRLGLSRRHFIRLFQQYTGSIFSEYIQQKRIELACQLLIETDHRIEDIAHHIGYRDLDHFRHTFRKWMGVSPSAYRKKS